MRSFQVTDLWLIVVEEVTCSIGFESLVGFEPILA